MDYTTEQARVTEARVTADVAGLEKRVDMMDASNKELKTELLGALKDMKTELLMRADKTDASIQGVKTELKSDMQKLESNGKDVKTELKADIQGVKTELKADIQGVKTELKDVKVRMDRLEIIIGAVTMVAGIVQYINSNTEGIGKWLGKWPGGG